MLPVLFKLGPFVLYSFGLLMLIGFLMGLFVVWKKAREEHFDDEDILDTVLISAFWGMVGARVLYVVLNLEHLGFNVLDWVNIFGRPGFSFLGGLVGGSVSLMRQAKKRKWDFYEFADFVVMGLTLTMVFGWMGSFLNGSSFGLPTDSIVGMRFVGMFDTRHPVQLYAVVLYLLLFIYLMWVEGKYRTFEWYRAGKSGVRSGFLVFNFVIFLGVIQMLLSWFSPPVFQFGDMTFDLWIWALILILGLVGIYWRSGRDIGKDVKFMSMGKRRERIEKRRAKRGGGAERLQVESEIL